jgi:uncharacterized protein
MNNGLLENAGAFTKIMFAAFIVIVSFLITLVGGMLLAVPLFGIGFAELFDSLSNIAHPDYLKLLKYFQIIQSIGLFLVPSFVLAWFFGGDTAKYLQLRKGINFNTAVLTLFIMLSAVPAINLLAALNAEMSLPDAFSSLEEWMQRTEESAKQITELFLRADTTADLLFNLLLIAVIPAIGEELLFRGIVQRLFSEWTRNSHAGIWIAAILFSALHLQFYGFLPRTMLGVLFGYMLLWSGNIWVPVTAHFVNNAAAVIVYYFISKKQLSESIETFGSEPGEWLFVIVSLAIFIILTMLLYLRKGKHTAKNYETDD